MLPFTFRLPSFHMVRPSSVQLEMDHAAGGHVADLLEGVFALGLLTLGDLPVGEALQQFLLGDFPAAAAHAVRENVLHLMAYYVL